MPNSSNNYSEIGRALSMAEFKGMVVTELKYIKEEIVEIKECVEENKTEIDALKTFKTKVVAVAAFVSGCASVGYNLVKVWLNGK